MSNNTRALVLITTIVCACIGLSIASGLPDIQPTHMARLTLLIMLGVALIMQRNWARLVMAVLLSLSGTLALVGLVVAEASQLSPPALVVVMAVTYLVGALLLFQHPDIRSFCVQK
jgi:hypothetical protein